MHLPSLLAGALLFTSSFAAPNPSPVIEERAQGPGPGRVPSHHLPPNHLPPPTIDTKYFHEPGITEELGHYDIRYYLGNPVSYEDRGVALHNLIRSYLTVFGERGIETWIAHGTLLGWWWNGKIMPWDWDLDTQVSHATLMWLGENMNMTLHNYTGTDLQGQDLQLTYLLDVNPNIVERERGDGNNIIDARWIDIHNGLFIDITGLSEANPTTQPGIWTCKNYHVYVTRDIYPLRETVFEGVPARVPYNFDKILTDEYTPRALTKTYHLGHTWVPEQKEWVKQAPVRAGTRAIPHVPRSLQADEKPKSGLSNLFRVL